GYRRMVRPQRFLIHRQRSPVERLRSRVVAGIVQTKRGGVEYDRVVRPDLQAALKGGRRFPILALLIQGLPQKECSIGDILLGSGKFLLPLFERVLERS